VVIDQTLLNHYFVTIYVKHLCLAYLVQLCVAVGNWCCRWRFNRFSGSNLNSYMYFLLSTIIPITDQFQTPGITIFLKIKNCFETVHPISW